MDALASYLTTFTVTVTIFTATLLAAFPILNVAVAADTLDLGYALPAAGCDRDFHPLGVCHARHTEGSPSRI